MTINVAIVNSDRPTLDGLKVLLRATPGLRLVSACRSGHMALAELPTAKPQVIVLEPNLRDMPGLAVVPRLRTLLPRAFVLVMGREVGERTGQLAIESGAHGFLPLGARPPRIIRAIRELTEGGSPLTPWAARALVERCHWEKPPTDPPVELSRREQQVLAGFTRGFRAKEVADWLKLSTYTVQTHVRNIYTKLGARSTTHALALYGLPPGWRDVGLKPASP